MASHREFRFSKGGYSLYAQLDDSGGLMAVRYLVFNAGDELMDSLPSLGQASALIERLTQHERQHVPGLSAGCS